MPGNTSRFFFLNLPVDAAPAPSDVAERACVYLIVVDAHISALGGFV